MRPVISRPGTNAFLVAKKNPSAYIVMYRNFSFIGKKSKCEFQELTPNYLNNLCRLGLIEIPTGIHIAAYCKNDKEPGYKELQSDIEIDEIKKEIKTKKKGSVDFQKKLVDLTDFGKQFCSACVIDKNLQGKD